MLNGVEDSNRELATAERGNITDYSLVIAERPCLVMGGAERMQDERSRGGESLLYYSNCTCR